MTGSDKICTVSGEKFIIDDAYIGFYTKIGTIAPALCPWERMRRRLAFYNDRFLYKRKCSKTGKSIISMYNPDSLFPVYDRDVWYNNTWDGLEYGQNFSFSKPFFDQWQVLRVKVPMPNLIVVNCENSEFNNYINH